MESRYYLLPVMVVLCACVLVRPTKGETNMDALLERLSAPGTVTNKEILFRNTYFARNLETRVTQTNIVKLKLLRFGEYVRESSETVGDESGPDVSMSYLAVGNRQYMCGLNLVGEGKFAINNLGPSDEAESIHYNNPFGPLHHPLECGFSYKDLPNVEGISVDKATIEGDMGKLEFTRVDAKGDQETHTATFDLKRGVCVSSSVLQNKKLTSFTAEFHKPHDAEPSLCQFQIRYPDTPDYKVDFEFVVFNCKESDITQDQTFLTYYGFPEPKFSSQSSTWPRYLGMVSFVLILTLTILYAKTKQKNTFASQKVDYGAQMEEVSHVS